MISRRVSTVSDAFLRGNPLALAMASIAWAFVSGMGCSYGSGWGSGEISFKILVCQGNKGA